MPRTCSVCRHQEREAIEKALVAGEPFRNLAARYGTSATALYRHKANHLPAALLKSHAAAEVARADSVLEHVRSLDARAESLYQHAIEILEEARTAQDPDVAVKAIREAVGILKELRGGAELRAKLSGELRATGERTHADGSAPPQVAIVFVPQIGAPMAPVRIDPVPGRPAPLLLLPAPAETRREER